MSKSSFKKSKPAAFKKSKPAAFGATGFGGGRKVCSEKQISVPHSAPDCNAILASAPGAKADFMRAYAHDPALARELCALVDFVTNETVAMIRERTGGVS
jgi:hypothetical protein